MTGPRVVLALTAASFIGFGFAFSFWPVPMAAVVDIVLPTPTAKIDLAATYGGFELGFGLFLLFALFRPVWIDAGLWAGVLALGGFAAVRLGTLIASSGTVRPSIYVALVLELTGVLLNLWALKSLRPRTTSPT